MNISDFQGYILPRAKGCPGIVADFNARLAIIELCTKSLLWREDQSNVATIADTTSYAYGFAAGQQFVRLLSLTLAGVGVEVVDPRIGRARDLTAWVSAYAYGRMSGFELRPAQAAALVIKTHCAVAPTLAAATVPDEFMRFAEAIAHGALSRILTERDKTYSDPGGAARAQALWDKAIDCASYEAFNGGARVVQRTTKVMF